MDTSGDVCEVRHFPTRLLYADLASVLLATTTVISCSAEGKMRRRAEVMDRSRSLLFHYSSLRCSFPLSQQNKL